MSDFNRRQFLRGILTSLVQATGTVVLVSVAAPAVNAQKKPAEGAEPPSEDIQDRADRLAVNRDVPEEAEAGANEFRNGAFRNTPVGAFRNAPLGAFRNAPLGAFRNAPLGAFRNAPLGAFRNTPLGNFGNGGWPNGHWGGFGNGGWPNFGWRNW